MWHHSLIFVDKHVVTTCVYSARWGLWNLEALMSSASSSLLPTLLINKHVVVGITLPYMDVLHHVVRSMTVLSIHSHFDLFVLLPMPIITFIYDCTTTRYGSLVSIIQVCKWWKVSVIATHRACPACIRVRREYFLHIMI